MLQSIPLVLNRNEGSDVAAPCHDSCPISTAVLHPFPSSERKLAVDIIIIITYSSNCLEWTFIWIRLKLLQHLGTLKDTHISLKHGQYTDVEVQHQLYAVFLYQNFLYNPLLGISIISHPLGFQLLDYHSRSLCGTKFSGNEINLHT